MHENFQFRFETTTSMEPNAESRNYFCGNSAIMVAELSSLSLSSRFVMTTPALSAIVRPENPAKHEFF